MSYFMTAVMYPKDWNFYQKALHPPEDWDWLTEFDPNSSEEIFSVSFEDDVEIRLCLVSDDKGLFLKAEFYYRGEPLDAEQVLARSFEDEQSLLDTDLHGFMIRDEWHMVSYMLPGQKPVTFPYKRDQ